MNLWSRNICNTISQYAAERPSPNIGRMHSIGSEINAMILTSQEGLEFLVQQEDGRPLREGDFVIDLRGLQKRVMENHPFAGKAVSPLPSLVTRDEGSNSFQMIGI
jgi:hypothetical protein